MQQSKKQTAARPDLEAGARLDGYRPRHRERPPGDGPLRPTARGVRAGVGHVEEAEEGTQ